MGCQALPIQEPPQRVHRQGAQEPASLQHPNVTQLRLESIKHTIDWSNNALAGVVSYIPSPGWCAGCQSACFRSPQCTAALDVATGIPPEKGQKCAYNTTVTTGSAAHIINTSDTLCLYDEHACSREFRILAGWAWCRRSAHPAQLLLTTSCLRPLTVQFHDITQ